MTSIRKMLDYSEGVELEEISLKNGGEVVDQAYLVSTLRSPETWRFNNLSEAHSRFHEEVITCTDDTLVQSRLRCKE